MVVLSNHGIPVFCRDERYHGWVIGTRSRMSLCQYLEIQQQERTELIFNKYGIETPRAVGWGHPERSYIGQLQDWLRGARQESIEHVLTEIVRTQGSFYRNRTSNAQTYQERYDDLIACLALDGYIVNGSELLVTEPISTIR